MFGIDMPMPKSCVGCPCYHDVACYAEGERKEVMLTYKERHEGRMTGAQWVYMRQQQIKWVAPTILAGILLALHRKYKFGYRRCSQIYAQILDIENEFGMDPKRLKAACLEETEVKIHDRNKYRRKGGE